MRDQERIIFPPVFLREDVPQEPLCLIGRPCPDGAEPVGDAVDMGIDGDARQAEALGDHDIGRFPSHALDGEQLVQGIGHDVVVFFDDGSRDFFDKTRLHLVEAYRIDDPLDLPGGDRQQLTRCAGPFHQALHGLIRCFILCSQAEQAADEHEKRVMPLVGDPRDNGDVGHIKLFEALDHFLEREWHQESISLRSAAMPDVCDPSQ